MSIPIALVAEIGRHNRSISKVGGLLRRVPDDMRSFAGGLPSRRQGTPRP